jgi:hypothetical protein
MEFSFVFVCEDMACCSSECTLTFLNAGYTILYVNVQFVLYSRYFLYTLPFAQPLEQQSDGVKSGDLVAITAPPILRKVSLRC